MGLTAGPDPSSGAVREATKGLLDWSKEQILEFAARVRNRQVAFVQDKETVAVIHAERKSEEFQILKTHIHDQNLRIIATMGLTLRRLEQERASPERLQDLRTKIFRKYGARGLRGAELVQRGVLGVLYVRLLRQSTSKADIDAAVESLLDRVEEYTAFIQEKDEEDVVVKRLSVRVVSHEPRLFVILGHGVAKAKAKRVVSRLLKRLGKGYGSEVHETDRDFYAFVGVVREGEVGFELPV